MGFTLFGMFLFKFVAKCEGCAIYLSWSCLLDLRMRGCFISLHGYFPCTAICLFFIILIFYYYFDILGFGFGCGVLIVLGFDCA